MTPWKKKIVKMKLLGENKARKQVLQRKANRQEQKGKKVQKYQQRQGLTSDVVVAMIPVTT